MAKAEPIIEGKMSKGGQNTPNLSSKRPKRPGGSGGKKRQDTVEDFEVAARAIVDRIARERDKLRDLVDDCTDKLQSIDEAADCFEDGLTAISKYL